MKQSSCARWCAVGLGAWALLFAATAYAAPTMDGEKDAEYTQVATSDKDNLLVDPADSIDDPNDPRAKALDVTNLYATNTGSDLYLYIELPYLDLNVIAGEWAVVFHLGGANDALQRLGVANDPYGAAVDYGHIPAANAVLKSNMRGFLADYDGNQGYAFLNAISKDLMGWDWENGNFLGDNGWNPDATNGVITGVGKTGGTVVYKAGKGIEVKIPLALFAANPANTDLVAPKGGDPIQMQFYDNIRERDNSNKYPRGNVDSVPFDESSRTDPLRGYIAQWATYTLKVPPAMEVAGVQMQSITDLEHLVVKFSEPVGAGATDAANYTVLNEKTNATIPVSSAVIDPGKSNQVILSLAIPTFTTLKVTVSNAVKAASGSALSTTLNSGEVIIGAPVVFNLYDPWGAIAQLGNDPNTGKPYVITIPGDFNGWANQPDGSGEIVMSPVAGETGHWRSPTIVSPVGLIGYKYRVPTVVDKGNYDAWNALNPHDRRYVVRPSDKVVEVNDNAAGIYDGVTKTGPPVQMTFTFVDLENKVNGGSVYVTGTWNNWSPDVNIATKLTPVAGQANTYRGTLTTPDTDGQDMTAGYKYLIINETTGEADWNTLNPNGEWNGDHWALIKGTGTPPVQSVEDVLGPKVLRISRIASGVSQAPGWAGYWRELDTDVDGQITLMDAIRAMRP